MIGVRELEKEAQRLRGSRAMTEGSTDKIATEMKLKKALQLIVQVCLEAR